MQGDHWADEDELDVNQLWTEFDAIREQSRYRVQLDYYHCTRYYDRAYQGFAHSPRGIDGKLSPLLDEYLNGKTRFSENVVQRIIGMIAAKFARQRTMPSALTQMGDWGLQRRADKTTRFLQGILHQNQVFEQQRGSDITDIINGTGVLHVPEDDEEVIIESIPPWQVFTDTFDGRQRNPDVIYWLQTVPVRRLRRKFSELKDQIDRLERSSDLNLFDTATRSDSDNFVEVLSAWSKPSGPNEGDGMYACACRGLKLEARPYTRMRLPFAFSRYMVPPDGMWGFGVVSMLLGMQDELNRSYDFRRVALQRMAAPFILLQKGAKIVETQINNLIGHLVYWTGAKPEIVTPGVIHPEQFQHTANVRSAMFAQAGLSELAASSMKPAGVNSGEALRVYSDMMDDTFHDAMLRRDQQILDVSEIVLDRVESIAEASGSYRSKYVGPFGFESIKYSQIKGDRDAIHLKVVSTSALASTFAGRVQDVKDIQGTGVVLTPQEAEKLINLPDLSESRERRYSMENLLMELFESEFLEKGNYIPPEPRWDIELALALVSQTILMAQLNNCPKEKIDLLRQFEQDCLALVEAANSPPPPPSTPPESPIAGGEMLAGAPAQ